MKVALAVIGAAWVGSFTILAPLNGWQSWVALGMAIICSFAIQGHERAERRKPGFRPEDN